MPQTATAFENRVETIAAENDATVSKVATTVVSPTGPDAYAVITVDAGAVDAVPAGLLLDIADAGLSVIDTQRIGESTRVGVKVTDD